MRRISPLLLIVSLLALVLAGCGDDTSSEEEAAPSTSDSASGEAAGAFPVEIEHLWGTTTVEEAPERVVALGVTDADAVLALGITPVALAGFSFFETGLGPWAEAKVEGELPQLLTGEPNVELIASLDPDLIIAVSAGFEEPVYRQLAEVAPTIVRPEGTQAYQVPRADATRMIGTALGKADEADALIDAADERYDEAIAEHPEFEGKTAVVVLPYDGKYGAYTPRDARGRVMDQLGFDLPPALAELDDGTNFFIELSQEQVELLDADVLVMLADAPAARAFVDGDAVLQGLPVVTDGRMVVLDTDTRGAITYNSVLSVPFALDQLVPKLAEVLS